MRNILRNLARIAVVVAIVTLAFAAGAGQSGSPQEREPSLVRVAPDLQNEKITAVVTVRQAIPEMRWGARDPSGPQMGAWFNPETRYIHCLIRNAGASAVTINTYQLTCGGFIKVFARIAGTTEWTEIDHGFCAHGAGPSDRQNVTLGPGQYLVGDRCMYAGDTQTRPTVKRFECSFISSTWAVGIPNPAHKPIEIRVDHELPSDRSPDVWQGTLSSGVIRVRAQDLPSR